MKDKDDLTKLIEDEGLAWLQIAISSAVILALVLAAIFADYEASRAQADPMPILQLDTLFIPQVTK